MTGANATGQAVAYTCFRRDENEARQANVLTHDRPGGSPRTSPSCPSCYPAKARNNLRPVDGIRRPTVRPNCEMRASGIDWQ